MLNVLAAVTSPLSLSKQSPGLICLAMGARPWKESPDSPSRGEVSPSLAAPQLASHRYPPVPPHLVHQPIKEPQAVRGAQHGSHERPADQEYEGGEEASRRGGSREGLHKVTPKGDRGVSGPGHKHKLPRRKHSSSPTRVPNHASFPEFLHGHAPHTTKLRPESHPSGFKARPPENQVTPLGIQIEPLAKLGSHVYIAATTQTWRLQVEATTRASK